jgi:hypothetical protein
MHRNQFVFNLAAAQLRSLVELDGQQRAAECRTG